MTSISKKEIIRTYNVNILIDFHATKKAPIGAFFVAVVIRNNDGLWLLEIKQSNKLSVEFRSDQDFKFASNRNFLFRNFFRAQFTRFCF